jgi:type IV pilus assembly protein PilA
LGNFARLLDPHEARTRISPAHDTQDKKKRRDAGFSLIEIMAGMAIIAILALAILPQFSKYFERASLNNLSSEVANAALTVESDFSLTGKAKYVEAAVDASITTVNKDTETALAATVDTGTGAGFGYTIRGTNTAVTNYCVKYVSQGTTAGLQITKKATPAALCP